MGYTYLDIGGIFMKKYLLLSIFLAGSSISAFAAEHPERLYGIELSKALPALSKEEIAKLFNEEDKKTVGELNDALRRIDNAINGDFRLTLEQRRKKSEELYADFRRRATDTVNRLFKIFSEKYSHAIPTGDIVYMINLTHFLIILKYRL
jgi:hypothetical protein